MAKTKKRPPNKKLAEFVCTIRAERDISQADLSKLLGVGRAYVSHLEMGLFQYPMETLKTFMKILNPEEKKRLVKLMHDQVDRDLGL